MTAREMFEELGYVKVQDNYCFMMYSKIDTYPNSDWVLMHNVIFFVDDQEFIVFSYDTKSKETGHDYISKDLMAAIQQQIDELAWWLE